MKTAQAIYYKLSDRQPGLLMYDYRASCGRPNGLLDLPEERFNFTDFLGLDPDTTFLLEAGGDSMMPDIKSGDMLVFDAAATPHNGDIVVALLDGEEVVVKQYYRDDATHSVRLVPTNPEYQTITIAEPAARLKVQGVLRAALHSFRPRRPMRLYRLGAPSALAAEPHRESAVSVAPAPSAETAATGLHILHADPQTLLAKMHSLIDGHKGRRVALVVRCAVEEGHIMMPTFAALQREFGTIGSRQGYQQYMRSQKFSDSELAAVRKFLGE
ncbi:MAG: S24 family peptidase [Prevotellaceae bacterium]|nr:S24 family peptidase [Prevotellaceae bacterium]